MLGLGGIAKKLFGSDNDRKIKSLTKTVNAVNARSDTYATMSEDDLKNQTTILRARLQKGETLDDLLPDAFAVAREAAQRVFGMRPFDVQLMGGIILHQGKIAEMKTGEGKTLMATLAVYLNALPQKGVHVVTVNDYLAKRDSEWMGQLYTYLGLTVDCVTNEMDNQARRAAYACDVTYGTNNEFGFDYLRDNMKYSLKEMAQREHAYAIIDEVDSILIDEARTPLIISGPTDEQSETYTKINAVLPNLKPDHYEIDEKQRTATLTEAGNDEMEKILGDLGMLAEGSSLYDPENVTLVHHVNQALRAHKLFQKDKDYIVRDGKVVIIDEFTGRMMAGRRFGDGLHQALEAKENQPIQPENVTMASVTFQNYFRLYDKLSGMTGTAITEADEFMEIYGLDVVEVPTNKPILRKDEDDQIFRTTAEKYTAIADLIKDGRERGQPILVGTTSIEKSEALAAILKQKGIPHNVLNARFHEQEASIVAQAGKPGSVTIATNMAGRGTDIKLGGNPEMQVDPTLSLDGEAREAAVEKYAAETAKLQQNVLDAGGLWVIATERHESRRIDNQLRGRSGRQGDPGRSSFFLSLEDDLMRIFGSERMDTMLGRLGMKEGEAIVHPWVNKAIEKAQSKVEARNFDMRKNVLKYDDVMNDQRKVVFKQRREIMETDDLSTMVKDMRYSVIDDIVAKHVPPKVYADQWDINGLADELTTIFGVIFPVGLWAQEEGVDDSILRERLYEETDKLAAQKAVELGPDALRYIEKTLVLQTLDQHWREHIVQLEHLRGAIGLRGYGQRDPLNEFKSESFQLFDMLLSNMRHDVVRNMMRVKMVAPSAPNNTQITGAATVGEAQKMSADADSTASQQSQSPSAKKRIARNDPCPCGSGKKFKHCHGAVV